MVESTVGDHDDVWERDGQRGGDSNGFDLDCWTNLLEDWDVIDES